MATGGVTDLTSDEIIHIKCGLCTHENRTREAEKYCVECKDYFCSSCVGIHNKLSSIKGHQILDKGDFKSLGPEGSLPSYPTQRCSQHPLEVVTVYCKDHDEVMCGLCVAFFHRSCVNIISIPDKIYDLYKRSDEKHLKQQLTNMKKAMEEIKQTNETKILQNKEALNKKIESVRAFRQELDALLDKAEQDTIQELKEEFSKIEESLTDSINKAESLVNLLNEAASQLRKSQGNLAQEFVCVKSAQKLMVSGQKVETTHLAARDEIVSFTPEKSIKVTVKQIKTLGKVSVKTSYGQTFIPKDGLYKVKQRREIDVRLDNDKNDCCIWGSCTTNDGSLLLADSNNNKLKLLDMSAAQVKDNIDLPAMPKAVCMVSETKAAVSLENQSIQFVSLGDKMAATNTCTMNYRCLGIAYHKGKLFISDNETTVYIYDMLGLQQHSMTKDGSGKDMFISNQHIAVSACKDRVFVADWYDGIVVLDGQGNYLSTHKDNPGDGYRGMCTDDKNIFVANYDSNNIVQFGHSYKVLGKIGTANRPLSICFDHQTKSLIATQQNNNKLVIFELE